MSRAFYLPTRHLRNRSIAEHDQDEDAHELGQRLSTVSPDLGPRKVAIGFLQITLKDWMLGHVLMAYLLCLCCLASIDWNTRLCIRRLSEDSGVVRAVAPMLSMCYPHSVHWRLEVHVFVGQHIGIVPRFHILYN